MAWTKIMCMAIFWSQYPRHSHNAPNLLKIVAPRPDEGLKNLKSTFFEMFSNGVKPKVYFL